jgi:hypothetical protein
VDDRPDARADGRPEQRRDDHRPDDDRRRVQQQAGRRDDGAQHEHRDVRAEVRHEVLDLPLQFRRRDAFVPLDVFVVVVGEPDDVRLRPGDDHVVVGVKAPFVETFEHRLDFPVWRRDQQHRLVLVGRHLLGGEEVDPDLFEALFHVRQGPRRHRRLDESHVPPYAVM